MNNLGIEHLYNPIALARQKHVRCLMASSYDRRGGNRDWSNYIDTEGNAAVLMEVEGPGCITRIWTADPQQGTLRIFLDGQPAPVIEMPLKDLFGLLPLSFGLGGESQENRDRSVQERLPMGYTSYCPIPFQHSCKVTIEPLDDYLYYQINYHLCPPGTHIDTFDPALSLDTPAIRQATAVWNAWEQSQPLRSWADAEHQTLNVDSDESVQFLNHSGAGIIHGLRIALPSSVNPRTVAHLRDNLWLTAHFDDDQPRDPSVRAPLGPLFLDFGQKPAPRSLFLGTDPEGTYYSFFPMPYAQSASLHLINRSLFSAEGLQVSLLHERLPELPSNLLRFRATWHSETPFGPDHRDYEGVARRLLNLDGRDNYEFLNVRAAGHFVGCGFHVDLRDAPTDRAAGEGDEMFFIDDDPRLTLYGTGAEDYINDAWGIRGYCGPLSGSAVEGAWGVDPQFYGYRLHLPDCVPFVRKGRFTLEHGTGNNCSGLYRSVAYWYQHPSSNRTRTEEAHWESIRHLQP